VETDILSIVPTNLSLKKHKRIARRVLPFYDYLVTGKVNFALEKLILFLNSKLVTLVARTNENTFRVGVTLQVLDPEAVVLNLGRLAGYHIILHGVPSLWVNDLRVYLD
jgi:hypothetical protein